MYAQDLEIGERAVKEAMRICRTIQAELTQKETITKSDKSPVTIADFASQAIICHILNHHFPDTPIVAEECSAALKKTEHKAILDKILFYLEKDQTIKSLIQQENLFASIDLGCSLPNLNRFWTLDPIDGTKGFLRGEQFAVALALIVHGEVVVGILGCPNLKVPEQQSKQGYIVTAIKGEKTYLTNVDNGHRQLIHVSALTDPHKMRFVESYVSEHSHMEMQLQISRRLEMAEPPVQMDSQVKYAIVAGGNAEIYVRIPHPKTPDYKEKIWDHAAGSLIVEEAGGIVTDIEGKKLDFTTGTSLINNRGILVSIPVIHKRILQIIKEL